MRIREDDPRRPPVTQLLEAHLALMRAISPPGSVHALDLDGLAAPGMTFWTGEKDGEILACGALKELDTPSDGGGHGEIKSMHTGEAARGRGFGDAMLRHILSEAKARGYERLSLETGRPDTFGPAQRLYRRHGFQECPPFAGYTGRSVFTVHDEGAVGRVCDWGRF